MQRAWNCLGKYLLLLFNHHHSFSDETTYKHYWWFLKLYGAPGLQIPAIGLGTWRAPPEEVENAVNTALENGYRHIDTAFNYNNEESIGNVLKKWIVSEKIRRNDLFITTKLPNFGNRASDVTRFLKLSLERLKLDYIDLYLIHMPFAFVCDEGSMEAAKNEDGSAQIDKNNNNFETWKVMEEQVQKGLIKAIGLSNFNEEQVRYIYDNSEIKPSVLQIEMHAYLQQQELVNTCKELNIAVTAYAPLGSPEAKTHFMNKYNYTVEDFPDLLGHPVVTELAKKYEKSAGQILLKHLLQKGVAIIPKSSNAERIKQNINLYDFEITPDDVAPLDAMDRGNSGRIFDFLFMKGIEQHPEYPFIQ